MVSPVKKVDETKKEEPLPFKRMQICEDSDEESEEEESAAPAAQPAAKVADDELDELD